MTGAFVGLDAATLATMRTEWLACLTAIATAHQAYQIGGRNFTRANLKEVRDTLGEINYAYSILTGTRLTETYADMSNGVG